MTLIPPGCYDVGIRFIQLQNKKEKIMDVRSIIELILKALAMAMAIASIVMGFFPRETNVDTHITLLSIGLAALSIAALQ